MKRFAFSLQPLLDYRKRYEDRLKRELAEIKRRKERQRRIIEQLHKKRTRCEEELRKRRSSGEIEIASLLIYQSYLDKLSSQIKRETEKMEQIFLKIKNKQKQIIEASKNKKVLEKLKEKRWLKFVDEVEKAKQHFIDEIAITKFNRSKASEKPPESSDLYNLDFYL